MQHFLTSGVFALLIVLFGLIASDFKNPWARESALEPGFCEPHRRPQAECDLCNPKLARGGTFAVSERKPKDGECPNTLVRITLAPEVAKQIGLELHTLEPQLVAESLRVNAETMFTPSRFTSVAPRISGIVREVTGSLGQAVAAGETLAIIESLDFSVAKSEYLQALAILRLRERTRARKEGLAKLDIAAERELIEAEAELEEAKLTSRARAQKLSTLGLAPAEIEAVAANQDTTPEVRVTAPFAGTIVTATAVSGEIAPSDKAIFSIAALDRMWLAMDVYEADYPKIEKGQRVTFTADGLLGKRFSGKVVAIGAELEEFARTVRVWAEVKNADGLLIAKMFGRAEITVKPANPILLAPKAAVQSDGDCQLAFVSPSKDVFQARRVDIGRAYEGGYEIVGGLAAGERIVTQGSFLLKTEVLRGQMGVG